MSGDIQFSYPDKPTPSPSSLEAQYHELTIRLQPILRRLMNGGLVLSGEIDNCIKSYCKDRERTQRQEVLEEAAKIAESYLRAFDISKQVDVAEFCRFQAPEIAKSIRERINNPERIK